MKFKEYSFLELLSAIVDNRGKTAPTEDSGIPLIATNCIKNDFLYPSYDKVRYVSKNTYNSWFRAHPKPGDMIFTCKGSPGRVCWVPDPIDFCIAQDMVGIRANTDVIYPKYLFALLRSEETQNKILNMHVGTLIPHFKKGDFGNLYFHIPVDLNYQKIVGDAYFDFCLKIETNHQTKNTLEAMAQTIFKSWFVDFDPVRAKQAVLEVDGSKEEAELAAMAVISGKTPADIVALKAHTQAPATELQEGANVATGKTPSEIYAELAATAALFPASLIESEISEIPEGWDLGNISDIAGLNKKSWTKTKAPEFVHYVDLANTKNGMIEETTEYRFSDAPSRARRILTSGDTIIGTVRPGNRSFAFIKENDKQLTGSTGFAVLSPIHVEWQEFVYLAATCDDSIEEFARLADGGAYPAIKPTVVADTKIVIPNKLIRHKFHEIVSPLLSRYQSNLKENHSLAQLRDTLLPKLLSGELSLDNVERDEA